eukprot:scaffold7226_cov387-Prasinococcus_capsulatus_cf.AAC.14
MAAFCLSSRLQLSRQCSCLYPSAHPTPWMLRVPRYDVVRGHQQQKLGSAQWIPVVPGPALITFSVISLGSGLTKRPPSSKIRKEGYVLPSM